MLTTFGYVKTSLRTQILFLRLGQGAKDIVMQTNKVLLCAFDMQ